jgi:hypothetical protein
MSERSVAQLSVDRAALSAADQRASDRALSPTRKLPCVFLSHSSKDKWFVRQIEKCLRGVDIRLFLDERDIQYGQPIDETLVLGLRQCDVLLVLISPNSVRSDWVKFELGAAWALDKEIIPVVLASVKKVPVLADRLKYISAVDQQSGLAELRRHMLGRFGGDRPDPDLLL